MDNKELEGLIPSETVRKYIKETKWAFTDFEYAALIYHSGLPAEKQNSLLRKLQDRTGDRILQGQIMEYLKREEQRFQIFKENRDKSYIYAVKVRASYLMREPVSREYFFNWKAALEYGIVYGYSEALEIEKYPVNDAGETGGYTHDHLPISKLHFNAKGEILSIESMEDSDIEYDEQHFTKIYFEVPNPFERGDIVTIHGRGYGVVETSQEEWKGDVAICKEAMHRENTFVDSMSIRIQVAVFNEEYGTFDFGYGITPLELEHYQPKIDGEDAYSARDRVLLSRSLVDRGEGSLDSLFSTTVAYRDSLVDKWHIREKAGKFFLKVIGKGCWMTADELYERVEAAGWEYDHETFSVLMCQFQHDGLIQYAYTPETDIPYWCGLE